MINHRACTHPATNAGRTACRKAMGTRLTDAIARIDAHAVRTPNSETVAEMIAADIEMESMMDDYCEGCEDTDLPLNPAGYCPTCVAAAKRAGHGARVTRS